MPSVLQTPLPVDRYVPEIVAALRRERFAVVVAPPGSGKTTRIPPALAELGPTILLQPRRVAARALTRRIAAERGWTIGEEIGWQIRFERRFTARTRLLVATEGILTARLQSDPLLSDFRVVILDEFHERSIHADLALAMVKEAARSRDDLAVVVMSATMDAVAVAAYLGEPGTPVRIFDIEARRHPVELRYAPGSSMAQAVRAALPTASGDLLCFLPGVREIERARAELAGIDALVLPLHGTLEVDAQERALMPAARRKVILSTNVAETSLTVEGVTEVIDSGLQKVLRYDAASGVDHLTPERISLDSAAQRSGRAGRTGPGCATRLWDSRDLLRPHREPDVQRIDLASTVLDLIAWGGDPRTFDWFEHPSSERLEAALDLLRQLGALHERRLTAIGEQLRRFPLHPRLGRLIVAAHGSDTAVAIAAALSEGIRLTRSETTASDALALADAAPPQIVRELAQIARRVLGDSLRPRVDEETLLRAILAGYPDRVAMRREPRSERLLLSSGVGATLARESGVRDGELLVALEVSGSGTGEALVRMASLVERDWLTPTRREKVHTISNGRVRAVERLWVHGLLLRELNATVDPEEGQRLIAHELRAQIDPLLLRRLAFAGLEVDWDALLLQAAAGRDKLSEVDLSEWLPYEVRRRLGELAPATFPLPSGRSSRLDYRDDGSVVAAAKLQELFGLAETPRIGPSRTPITFELLSPGGRPVQVTQDLRSFWNNTYQEVRRELRIRYPRHPWPDDPWTATPTHKTVRRR
jgi:ATP-dependent helicase HrpB